MSAPEISADETGLRIGQGVLGTWDVLFDGVPVWSLAVGKPPGPSGTFVAWPEAMRPWLEGCARVELRSADGSHDLGEVRFGVGEDRVRFVDENGIPVVVDKWGIVQRPFTGRGAGVTDVLVKQAQEIIWILHEDCGIDAWMAFGTLLGAVREGGVIGHDSDVDLAFLSEESTPAGVAREMYAARRALARRGLLVVNKTGSFITVLFTAPDGALASVDVYSCFYVDGLLHETATVRADVPREAILPLRTLDFEGHSLPAPADPETMLVASYGPDWRTPDPAFRHEPTADTNARFNGWFGSFMWDRRDWEAFWQRQEPPELADASDFAVWASRRLQESCLVVDVGAGSGIDAAYFASAGHRAVALDYARETFDRTPRPAPDLAFDVMNLLDPRDALTRAALLVRRHGPHVLYARSLLDALNPAALATFWRFVGVLMRGGGRVFFEFAEPPPRGGAGRRFPGPAGPRFPVHHHGVQQRIRALGGSVTERQLDLVPPEEGTRRWRIVGTWTV